MTRTDEEKKALFAKWDRVGGYLRTALSTLKNPEKEEVEKIEEWLEHNELGLAYEDLIELRKTCSAENVFDENMELVAKEMELKYERPSS